MVSLASGSVFMRFEGETQAAPCAIGFGVLAFSIGGQGSSQLRQGGIGTGANGSCTSADLVKNGFDVTLFDQWPAHVEMIHVPYKGLGPALLDVIAGRVDMTLATILSSDQFVKANRLRPIAVTSPKRSPLMPAIPTISELGYPSYDVALWYGLVAPGATPAAVVNRLNAALREAVKDPAFRAKMAASDAEILVRSPEEFAAFLSRERVKWAGAARSAKVQLEQ